MCHSKLGLYSATLPSTPYLIIIHTKVKRGRADMEWATPNSVPLQRLTGQGRERMSGVVSHVTTMQLEGSRNEGGWKQVKR